MLACVASQFCPLIKTLHQCYLKTTSHALKTFSLLSLPILHQGMAHGVHARGKSLIPESPCDALSSTTPLSHAVTPAVVAVPIWGAVGTSERRQIGRIYHGSHVTQSHIFTEPPDTIPVPTLAEDNVQDDVHAEIELGEEAAVAALGAEREAKKFALESEA